MSWKVTQSTPTGETPTQMPFINHIDAKVFAEEFLINEDDMLTDVNRRWCWNDTERHWVMDVHADYSIVIKELK